MITSRELALIPDPELPDTARGAAGPGAGRPPRGTDPGMEPEEALPPDRPVDGAGADTGR